MWPFKKKEDAESEAKGQSLTKRFEIPVYLGRQYMWQALGFESADQFDKELLAVRRIVANTECLNKAIKTMQIKEYILGSERAMRAVCAAVVTEWVSMQ